MAPDSMAIIRGVTPAFVVASMSTVCMSARMLKVAMLPARAAKWIAVRPMLSC